MFLNLKIFSLNFFIDKNLIFIYNLNNFLITIFIILFFFLFIILFTSILFHRKFLQNKIYIFYENYILELLWIFFPLILVIYIFIYSSKILFRIKNNNNSVITIKIIGYQWKWYYNYLTGLGKNLNYFSTIKTSFFQIFNLSIKEKYYLHEVDNNLVLPVKKYIRFIFTSNDVIHSWYIPSLNLKQDTIPGFFRDIYFIPQKKGKYRGFCTELCGNNHSFMPIVINIISLVNYKKWILSKYFTNFLKFKY